MTEGKTTIRHVDRTPPPQGKGWAQGYPESQVLTPADLPFYRVLYVLESLARSVLGQEMLWAVERTPTSGCFTSKMVIPRGTKRDLRAAYIGVFTQDINAVRGGEPKWW